MISAGLAPGNAAIQVAATQASTHLYPMPRVWALPSRPLPHVGQVIRSTSWHCPGSFRATAGGSNYADPCQLWSTMVFVFRAMMASRIPWFFFCLAAALLYARVKRACWQLGQLCPRPAWGTGQGQGSYPATPPDAARAWPDRSDTRPACVSLGCVRPTPAWCIPLPNRRKS